MTVWTDSRQARAWPAPRWDDGITWRTRRTVEPTTPTVSVAYVQDRVLRLADLSSEVDFVESLIWAATQAAEEDTQRAIPEQTWEMELSGFPASGRIVLERPPLIEVTGLSYYDADGAAQQLAVSPSDFEMVGSGAYGKAELRPMSYATWPSTESRPDAVTVTYTAGYASLTDPVVHLLNAGICLMVAELYKQRTLSVHAVHNTPALLDLRRFWKPVR